MAGCISGNTQQTSKSWGLGPLPASDPRDGLIPFLISSRLKGPDCTGQLQKQYIKYTKGAAPCCLSLLWGMKAGTGWDQERVMEFTAWKKKRLETSRSRQEMSSVLSKSPSTPTSRHLLYYTTHHWHRLPVSTECYFSTFPFTIIKYLKT